VRINTIKWIKNNKDLLEKIAKDPSSVDPAVYKEA